MSISRAIPVLGAFACIGALSMMAISSRSAQAAPPVMPAPAALAIAAPTPAVAPAATLGEQPLETNVQPAAAPGAEKPVLTTHNLKASKLRAGADEHLPKWVPARGRLTVVDSSDLAENLGLVPKGTTKASDERISVANKLAEESAARAAASKSDPMTQGTSWSYAKPGRVRSRL